MATIRDVAAKAGVSQGTVSNVFNDRPYVNESTRQKVLQAAELVGYRRNTVARSLRLGRRTVLGACLRDIGNPTFSRIVLGAEAVARQHEYQFILGNSAGERSVERRYLEEFVSQRVAGIITAPVDDATSYRSVADAGIPAVFINQRPAGGTGTLVKHDYAGGTTKAVEYLLGRGHERIGIVYGPELAAPGKEQQAAFRAAMHDAGAGVEPGTEVFATFGLEGAFVAAMRLLANEPRPTALIGSTLAVTLGCIRAIAELELSIDVIGTGDEVWLQAFPSLAYVRQHSEELGRVATQQLIQRIDGEAPDGPETIVLPVDLQHPRVGRRT